MLGAAAFASSAKLSSQLLSINQMPTGWSVDNSSSGDGVGCLSKTLEPKGITQTSKAESQFQANGGVPAIDEKIATYTSATGAFQKILANLAKCKRITGKSSGNKVTGTIGEMSFPPFGDESAAFAISLTTQGTTFSGAFDIVREGKVIMGIEEFSASTVNIPQFHNFVVKALAKLGGGSTKPPAEPTTTTTKPSPGSTSTISFKDENGNPYKVDLIVLYDPISGADQYTTPKAGFRFVAADFRITDTGSKQISDDANLNATVTGQNGQTYTADFDSMSGCTNFSDGEYQLNPGETATGCVAFQVPIGVNVAKVRWSPNLGSGSFGEWSIK
ncbi:MAG: DUF4352 domain-containing protein [Terriglobales bacterium]